jgi:hypothetical protein
MRGEEEKRRWWCYYHQENILSNSMESYEDCGAITRVNYYPVKR